MSLYVFQDQVSTAATELIAQEVDKFNAASGGALVMGSEEHIGDYIERTSWQLIGQLAQRLVDMQQRLRARIEIERAVARGNTRVRQALDSAQTGLMVIDAEGQVLPASDLAPFAQLPLLVGERARLQAPAILKIIASRPDLSGDVQAAVWVGDRRWDVRMKSGETISLPEGAAAAASWLRFADLNTQSPLLGRGFVRFDFRIPDKMVVRVETDPGQTVKPRANPQPAQPQPAQPPAAIAGTQPRAAQPMQMARSAQPQPEEVVI